MKPLPVTSSNFLRKIELQLFLAIVAVGIIVLATEFASGASVVLDSFDSANFQLDPDDPGTASAITGPIGTVRTAFLEGRLAAPGTTLLATLSSADGTLEFLVDGPSIDIRPMTLHLSYREGGSFSLLPFDAFEFDFSELGGSGFIILELGSATGPPHGDEAVRIPLNSAGVVEIGFDNVNLGRNGSLASSEILHVTFEAESDPFSFTLDEIRLVPEPSAAILLCIAAGALAAARRRAARPSAP